MLHIDFTKGAEVRDVSHYHLSFIRKGLKGKLWNRSHSFIGIGSLKIIFTVTLILYFFIDLVGVTYMTMSLRNHLIKTEILGKFNDYGWNYVCSNIEVLCL